MIAHTDCHISLRCAKRILKIHSKKIKNLHPVLLHKQNVTKKISCFFVPNNHISFWMQSMGTNIMHIDAVMVTLSNDLFDEELSLPDKVSDYNLL